MLVRWSLLCCIQRTVYCINFFNLVFKIKVRHFYQKDIAILFWLLQQLIVHKKSVCYMQHCDHLIFYRTWVNSLLRFGKLQISPYFWQSLYNILNAINVSVVKKSSQWPLVRWTWKMTGSWWAHFRGLESAPCPWVITISMCNIRLNSQHNTRCQCIPCPPLLVICHSNHHRPHS